MSQRATTAGLVVAWLVFLASVATLVAATRDALELAAPLVPNTLLIVCGTIIVRRSRQRVIGWLLVVPGSYFNLFYPVMAVDSFATSGWTAYLRAPLFVGLLPLMLLILTFPSGRFPSRAARVVGWTAAAHLMASGLLDVARVRGLVELSADEVFEVVAIGAAFVAVIGLTIQARHYRRRPVVEQQQIKWFLLAIVGVLLYPLTVLVGTSDAWFFVADAVSTSLWPVTILIAITRHRLYDIDRLVSRTVAYALVIGMLALTYVALATLLSSLLPTQDRFAIAATTVVVVALFHPLRRRVRDAVDKRFNRTRYTAQQVIEQFGREIQQETDVARVRNELGAVLAATMAPRAVAVWEPPVDQPPDGSKR